jgi:hypothetical protein
MTVRFFGLEIQFQELRQRIDLVIVSAARELCDFDKEVFKPIGASGHVYVAAFNLRGLKVHAGYFVALGVERDSLAEAQLIATQLLN